MSVSIRRSSSRFAERGVGRITRHAFAFGAAYDPEWLSFGPLACHDDHLLGAGMGFEEHPHSALEIVSWVVSGTIEHRDSTGATTVLRAGECAVLSAGSGVRHSEMATADGSARFVQVWLTPDEPDLVPSYASVAVDAEPGAGLVPVAGPSGPLAVGVAGAEFSVARLGAGESVTLPAAGRVYAFVATGALLRFSLAEPLGTGDAICMVDEPVHEVTAAVPTDLLVWSFAS